MPLSQHIHQFLPITPRTNSLVDVRARTMVLQHAGPCSWTHDVRLIEILSVFRVAIGLPIRM